MQETLAFTVCPFGRKRMMSTRRTFLTFGLLMAVVALFMPAPAPAQTVQDVDSITAASVVVQPTSPASHDMLTVTWSFTRLSAANAATTDMFRVYYGLTAFTGAGDLVNAMGSMDVAVPSVGLLASATLTGLKANTEYFVAVSISETTTATGAVEIGAPVIGAAGATTAMAAMPDRVLGVEVTPGDGMLMVDWDAPYAGATGLTIKAYHVDYRTSKTETKDAGKWMHPDDIIVMTNSATISNVMNGTMYDIRVRAKNSADALGAWSQTVMATPGMDGTGTTTTPMPTPALPLFGILALFGGLLAAGRARLRR